MSNKHIKSLVYYCLIASFILVSCQSPKNKTLEQLQGVWYIDCDSIRSNDDLRGFEFFGDTVGRITIDGTYIDQKMVVIKDTLPMYEFFGSRKTCYGLKKLTNDSLWIVSDGRIEKYYKEYLDHNIDSKYTQIEIRIGHFDDPGIKLQLDSSGFVESRQRFKDSWITKKYRLSNNEKRIIDSAYAYCCVNKFRIFNWTNGEDGWPKTMRIKTNGKWIEFKTINTNFPRRLSSIYYFVTMTASKRNIWIRKD